MHTTEGDQERCTTFSDPTHAGSVWGDFSQLRSPVLQPLPHWRSHLLRWRGPLLRWRGPLLRWRGPLLRWRGPLLHRRSRLLHRRSRLLHRRSRLLHRRSRLLHRRSRLLHRRSRLLHRRSRLLHRRSPLLHRRSPTPRSTPRDAARLVLTQALLPFGDSNWYTPLPGESNDTMFGRRLDVDPQVHRSRRPLSPMGEPGQLLDLPSGSQAISPTICVDSTYPTARTEVRVRGSVERACSSRCPMRARRTANKAKTTGHIHSPRAGWTLSHSLNVHPGNTRVCRLVRFTFVPGGKTSDFQIQQSPRRSALSRLATPTWWIGGEGTENGPLS